MLDSNRHMFTYTDFAILSFVNNLACKTPQPIICLQCKTCAWSTRPKQVTLILSTTKNKWTHRCKDSSRLGFRVSSISDWCKVLIRNHAVIRRSVFKPRLQWLISLSWWRLVYRRVKQLPSRTCKHLPMNLAWTISMLSIRTHMQANASMPTIIKSSCEGASGSVVTITTNHNKNDHCLAKEHWLSQSHPSTLYSQKFLDQLWGLIWPSLSSEAIYSA